MRSAIVALCGIGLAGGLAAGDVRVTLSADRDNTLYQSVDGSISNGAGQHFFAGTNAGAARRRGLLRFDVDPIPSGARITRVVLTLNMSRTSGGPSSVALHRMLATWGEGTSDAAAEEGSGAPATAGDATWLHAFYPGQTWTAGAEGAYAPSPSAAAQIDALGPYAWGSTAALVADVQAWVDDPGANHGWLLRGDEGFASSVKRFDSRENPGAAARPRLEVDYAPPAPPGDANCDDAVDFDDIDCFVAALAGPQAWAACGVSAPCEYLAVCDINADGQVNYDDIDGFVGCLAGGCP